MFAQTKNIEANRIGQFGLFNDVADHLAVRQIAALIVPSDIAKRVDSEFQRHDASPVLGLEILPNPPCAYMRERTETVQVTRCLAGYARPDRASHRSGCALRGRC